VMVDNSSNINKPEESFTFFWFVDIGRIVGTHC
jgi:hypothetical protein